MQDSRTNPTMHVKRGCIRVGCGSTQPGGEKGRPRRRKFGHKCGPGGHTRQPRGTRRVRLGMQGYKSLGVPRVHPHRRAEMSAGPMCKPVERAKSAVSSPLCPTSRTAAAPPGHACTSLHAQIWPTVVRFLRSTAAVGTSMVGRGSAMFAAGEGRDRGFGGLSGRDWGDKPWRGPGGRSGGNIPQSGHYRRRINAARGARRC